MARASRSKRARNCGSVASGLRQHLQRDRAIEARVGRVVHLTHSASAEQADRSGTVRTVHRFQIAVVVEDGCGRFQHRPIDQELRVLLREQRFDLAPSSSSPALASARNAPRSSGGSRSRADFIDVSDMLPALGIHVSPPFGVCRRVYAHAREQSSDDDLGVYRFCETVFSSRDRRRALVAHAVPAAEMNWLVPWGKPLSKYG